MIQYFLNVLFGTLNEIMLQFGVNGFLLDFVKNKHCFYLSQNGLKLKLLVVLSLYLPKFHFHFPTENPSLSPLTFHSIPFSLQWNAC